MQNLRMIFSLAAAIMVMAAGQGFGLTQFNDGDIHDIGTINDDVWVDYQAPGMYTMVNVYGGISYPYKLQGFNSGIINISGGFVTELDAHDSSQTTISSGWVGGMYAYNSSQTTISGGYLDGYYYAYDSSQTTLSEGGDIRWMYAYNSSQRTISGGSFSSIFAYDSSQTTILDGSGGNIYACNSSQATLSGGSFGAIIALDSSQTTISGGYVHYLFLYNNSKITIKGSNFIINGSPVDYGQYSTSNFSTGNITFTNLDNEVINFDCHLYDQASITLIPEPTTLLLLGLGGLMLKRKQ